MANEDLSRLPVWAQRKISGLQGEIGVLERNLADARQTLMAGPDDSDTFADPYSEVARPLGTRVPVRFGGVGFSNTFDVHFDGAELVIHAQGSGDQIAVIPKGSNTVRIRWVERNPR